MGRRRTKQVPLRLITIWLSRFHFCGRFSRKFCLKNIRKMGLNQLMVLVIGLLTQRTFCTELTFELLDKDRMCFHERIEKNVQSNLVYQVIVGGNYDVDVHVKAPNGQLLYNEQKKSYDSFTWTPAMTGVHTFCFSNEFSTFTHKLVYFGIEVGEDRLVGDENTEEHATSMTMMEAVTANIHGFLAKVTSAQIFFRNREAGGRQFAEDLNFHVILWSLGETVAVLVVGLGQVLVLRSFFSAPSPRPGGVSANGRIST